jgi:long-chain acyl-CoA synthetase
MIAVPLIYENMYNKIWDTARKQKKEKGLRFLVNLSNFLLKFKIDMRKKFFKSILNNFGGNIRLAIAGGAAADPKVLKGLHDFGFFVIQGYGLTETSPIAFVNHVQNYRHDSIGLPLPELDVKIDNPDENGVGELLIKGYNICNGYYKIPNEKQPFDNDGYLHTGDLGYIDEENYLFLTGRLKDIIIRKGENISPAEIEMAFEKYKEFTKVRVIGIPSLTDGESIIACVESKINMTYLREQQYLKDLHSILPSIKIPEHIICIKEFPLMASGKLDERKIREIVIERLSHTINPKLAIKAFEIQKRLKKQ